MKERENIQRIDFVRLVTLLTPTMMRSKVLMNIVRALVQPLVALNERRANERSDRLFWLRTTGQRRQLRYALNTWFGVEGFEIEDATQKGKWLMVHREKSPNYPTMLEDTTLLYSEKTVVGEHAFVVRYPKELKGREAEIRHIVSAYKVAGKDYQLKMEN